MPAAHVPPATAAHPPEYAHPHLPAASALQPAVWVTNGIHEYSLANPGTQVTDSGFHTEPCWVGTITLIRTELERSLYDAAAFSSSSTLVRQGSAPPTRLKRQLPGTWATPQNPQQHLRSAYKGHPADLMSRY